MTPDQLFGKYGQNPDNRRKNDESDADNIIPERSSPTEVMLLGNNPTTALNLSSRTESLPSLPSLNFENKNNPEIDTDKSFIRTLKHVYEPSNSIGKNKLVLPPIWTQNSDADSKSKIKSKSKNRCSFPGCKVKVHLLLGTGKCPKCSNNFCGNHRLYEFHDCPFYSDVKKEHKLNNEKTLLKNRTQQQMIAKI